MLLDDVYNNIIIMTQFPSFDMHNRIQFISINFYLCHISHNITVIDDFVIFSIHNGTLLIDVYFQTD